MIPEEAMSDLRGIIGRVMTVAEARRMRRQIELLQRDWAEEHGCNNDVYLYFTKALDELDEIIACHGQC